jgi:prolyl 4-hydroxylase|tara:strand:- start:341 stop:940 length:600 start_codon:yes stop_codon:yes gene_type:complete
MQRISLESSSLNPNFIGSWVIEPFSLCDDLITYFESNVAAQKAGVTGLGRDLSAKDRIDISIAPNQLELPGNEVFKTYVNSLFACYKDYLAQWPFLEQIGQNLEMGKFNLGRYQRGQHFQKMHAERSGLGSLHRVLAWMTYLNDVDEGGETYFDHYDLTIKPRKGVTLIWPAEWTHAHKGNVLLGESKYMITGWLTFTE